MELVQEDPPVYLLGEECVFPDPLQSDEEGLIAVGGDFAPRRLIAAYRAGIFPWFIHKGIPYWFSPDPRMILMPDRFHLSRSLARAIKSNIFEVRFDTDFEKIITGCAKAKRKEREKSWITKMYITAYTQLFEMGYAHCVGVYQKGELVGGLYGVQVGSVFCGESMFSLVSNASKVAFHALTLQKDVWRFFMIDCQVPNDHLRSMGGEEMRREEFLKLLG
jgi:leucyl/phenylalanyl-tRNA--protein transferase